MLSAHIGIHTVGSSRGTDKIERPLRTGIVELTGNDPFASYKRVSRLGTVAV